MSKAFVNHGSLLALALFVACQTGCFLDDENTVHAQDAQEARRIPVTAIPAREITFEERIVAQGNVFAKTTASAAPRINGVITDMYVEEGDPVVANETVLFQIDKVVVSQAHEIAQQDLKVAECARRDAEATLAAAQAQHDKAKLDYERFVRLRSQEAITPDAMEQMEAGYAVAKAQVERATAGLRLREEQEKQADAALAIARKNLDDSRILSPINGWVTHREKKQGEFAAAGMGIVDLTDPSVLEVSAFLPGEYYPRVTPGETTVHIVVSGVDLGTFPVSYKSPEIQAALRTFEIKCLIESPPEGIVPGAIANIQAVLRAAPGVGVPHEVVQVRNGKQVVFVVEDDVAKAIPIETGLTMDGWTEVLNGVVASGAPVIAMGCNLVNDGSPVAVQTETQQ